MRGLENKPNPRISPEFSDTMICEKMGWTYAELCETPEWFVQALLARLEVEARHQKNEDEKMRRKVAKTKAAHRH